MPHGMEFKQEGVHALVRLLAGDVAVPAGLVYADRCPPGRRQGRRLDSSAWIIRVVTSSRMAVWVGIVVFLHDSPYTT